MPRARSSRMQGGGARARDRAESAAAAVLARKATGRPELSAVASRAKVSWEQLVPRPKLWPAEEMRSPPISRVLLRRASYARYDRHSSRPVGANGLEPPTRGLGEQRRRPPIWRCSGWRLPRFTRFPEEATRLCGPVPRLRRRREALAIAAGRYPASCSVEPGLSSPSGNPRQRRSGGLRESDYTWGPT